MDNNTKKRAKIGAAARARGGGSANIEAILARIRHTTTTSSSHHGGRGGGGTTSTQATLCQPPDEASGAMGQLLAQCYLKYYFPQVLLLETSPSSSSPASSSSTNNNNNNSNNSNNTSEEAERIGNDILTTLMSHSTANGSCSYSYFITLANVIEKASIARLRRRRRRRRRGGKGSSSSCKLQQEQLHSLLDVWSIWIIQLHSAFTNNNVAKERNEEQGTTLSNSKAAILKSQSAAITGFVRVAFIYNILVTSNTLTTTIMMINDDDQYSFVTSVYKQLNKSSTSSLSLILASVQNHLVTECINVALSTSFSTSITCLLQSFLFSFDNVDATTTTTDNVDAATTTTADLAHPATMTATIAVITFLSPILIQCLLSSSSVSRKTTMQSSSHFHHQPINPSYGGGVVVVVGIMSHLFRQCRQVIHFCQHYPHGTRNVDGYDVNNNNNQDVQRDDDKRMDKNVIVMMKMDLINTTLPYLLSSLITLLIHFVKIQTFLPTGTGTSKTTNGRKDQNHFSNNVFFWVLEWLNDIAELTCLLYYQNHHCHTNSVGSNNNNNNNDVKQCFPFDKLCNNLVNSVVKEILPRCLGLINSNNHANHYLTSSMSGGTNTTSNDLIHQLVVICGFQWHYNCSCFKGCYTTCSSNSSSSSSAEDGIIFQLVMLCLSSSIDDDINAMLELIMALLNLNVKTGTGGSSNDTLKKDRVDTASSIDQNNKVDNNIAMDAGRECVIRPSALLFIVGSVLVASSNRSCSDNAKRLIRISDEMKSDNRGNRRKSCILSCSGLGLPTLMNCDDIVSWLNSLCPICMSSEDGGRLNIINSNDKNDGADTDWSLRRPSISLTATMQIYLFYVSWMYVLCDDDKGERAATTDLFSLGKFSYESVRKAALELAERLIIHAPNLAVRTYPIAMNTLNRAITSGDCPLVLSLMKLLCGPISGNPHCAKKIWKVLQSWCTDKNRPTTIRTLAIRMLARICQANRRMLGRAKDVLLTMLRDHNVEVRIAVAKTIAELSDEYSEDASSDLIGAIQAYLSDECPVVVSLALQSLHYLCRDGCLDFDLTVKVLKKRLNFAIDDVASVLKQDVVVVASLIILLGDCECEDDGMGAEDDNEDGREGKTTNNRSRRCTATVTVLLDMLETMYCSEGNLFISRKGIMTFSCLPSLVLVRKLSYECLANCSPYALGANKESILAEDDGTADRERLNYRRLIDVVHRCIQLESSDLALVHLVRLGKKLVIAEEDAFGQSLWTSPDSKFVASSQARSLPSKACLAALPKEESIRAIYDDEPSPASGIAVLFAFDPTKTGHVQSDIGDLLNFLAETACDVQYEGGNPLSQVIRISAWVHASRKLWEIMLSEEEEVLASNKTATAVTAIDGLASVCYKSAYPENGSIALAASALVISKMPNSPETLGFVEAIYMRVCDIIKAHGFNSDDRYICMGLLGAALIKFQYFQRVDDTIDDIESFLGINTGRAFLGPVIALGIIVHALEGQLRVGGSNQVDASRIKRITSRIMTEFIACFDDPPSILFHIATSVKSESPISLEFAPLDQGDLTVMDNLMGNYRTCCVALSFAMSPNSIIQPHVIWSIYNILTVTPPCIEQSLALSAAFSICFHAGVLTESQREQHGSTTIAGLEMTDNLGSAIIIAIGTLEAIPSLSRDEIIARSLRTLEFGKCDKRSVMDSSLIALCAVVGEVPFMPNRNSQFAFGAPCLRPAVTKAQVKKVVAMLESLTSSQDVHLKTREDAVIAQGMLCAMSNFDTGSLSRSIDATAFSDKARPTKKLKQVKFNTMPRARETTLVRKLLESIEKMCGVNPGLKDIGGELATLLGCLSPLPLPGQLAQLIDVFVHTPSDILTVECIRTLSLQVENFGTREFVGVAFKLACLPSSSLRAFLGNVQVRTDFVKLCVQCLSKFPSGAVETVLLNLWEISVEDLKSAESDEPVLALLRGVKAILEGVMHQLKGKAASVAPVVKRTVREVIPKFYSVFVEYVEGPCLIEITGGSENQPFSQMLSLRSRMTWRAWNAILGCIAADPSHFLEKVSTPFDECVDFGSLSSELCRVAIIVRLIKKGLFDQDIDRKYLEVTRIRSFLARQPLFESSICAKHAICAAFIDIARASTSVDEHSKKDIILRALEIWELRSVGADAGQISSSSLHGLAFHLSYWQQENVKETALMACGGSWLSHRTTEELTSTCFRNLPFNLGAISADLEIGTMIRKCAEKTIQVIGGSTPSSADRHLCDMFRDVAVYCYTGAESETDGLSIILRNEVWATLLGES